MEVFLLQPNNPGGKYCSCNLSMLPHITGGHALLFSCRDTVGCAFRTDPMRASRYIAIF